MNLEKIDRHSEMNQLKKRMEASKDEEFIRVASMTLELYRLGKIRGPMEERG